MYIPKICNNALFRLPFALAKPCMNCCNEHILWLELMQKRKQIYIIHALNDGEYQIPDTKYKADGYCKDNNSIYSFHGLSLARSSYLSEKYFN
jgi:hypothetical protein